MEIDEDTVVKKDPLVVLAWICAALALLMYASSGYALHFNIVRPYLEMFQSLGAELPQLTIVLLKIGDPMLGIVFLILSCVPSVICMVVGNARLKFILSGFILLLVLVVFAGITMGLELPMQQAQRALS